MRFYSFTFIVSGFDTEDDSYVDRLFEAGCDDATVALMNGAVAVCFDREHKSYLHAVFSACEDVMNSGATIERFEPDFLVNRNEIAKRAGLSRAAITQYVKGDRGKEFPAPYARVTSESPLWDWVEVSSWLHSAQHLGFEDVVDARVSRAMNMYFQGHQSTAIKTGDDLLLKRMSRKVTVPETSLEMA